MRTNIFLGGLSGKGLKIAIVIARFNQDVTERLLKGAQEALKEAGVAENDIQTHWVPGAFELPVVAARIAEKGGVDAIVCLGAIIKGGTPHHEYLGRAVASGIMRVSLDYKLAVAFGVLTADTYDQAAQRAMAGKHNKGYEAAMSAIEVASLLKSKFQISKSQTNFNL